MSAEHIPGKPGLKTIAFLSPLLFLLTCGPLPVFGLEPTASALKQSMEQEKERARAGKKSLIRLTQKERGLYLDLADVEDAIESVQKEIIQKERELSGIDAQIEQTEQEHAALTKRREKTLEELDGLIVALWPFRIQDMQGRLARVSAWDKADRRFSWTAAIYRDTREKLEQVRDQSRRIEDNLARQVELRADAKVRLSEINEAKDGLLRDKLLFLHRIQGVRAERVNREQTLGQIMATIKDLDYRLKNLSGKKFAELQGYMPWPAEGKTVAGFQPKNNPPQRGLGLSVPKNAPVYSVFWGKVVHNNVLRGFGRVVILYHGGNYYSLYAFLSESPVRIGQEMEKGEPLGRAGYYPKAKGPGLYFELRFGEKAINPEQWLAARS
ncbi:MAG: peptidoglycan DD-metalloendopeptidase family protein [Thermodesulfobacteriota bacterium]|nr:peptidoglycan DD-metalloendopeptidase family protein [Thermodesulfobacteriota bacterium]